MIYCENNFEYFLEVSFITKSKSHKTVSFIFDRSFLINNDDFQFRKKIKTQIELGQHFEQWKNFLKHVRIESVFISKVTISISIIFFKIIPLFKLRKLLFVFLELQWYEFFILFCSHTYWSFICFVIIRIWQSYVFAVICFFSHMLCSYMYFCDVYRMS